MVKLGAKAARALASWITLLNNGHTGGASYDGGSVPKNAPPMPPFDGGAVMVTSLHVSHRLRCIDFAIEKGEVKERSEGTAGEAKNFRGSVVQMSEEVPPAIDWQ